MPTRRRSFLRLASLLAAMPRLAHGAAEGPAVHAILGSGSESESAVARALRSRLARLQVSVGVDSLAASPSPAAYVAVGPAALQAASVARLAAPVIGIFASRQSVMRATSSVSAGGRVTAIYAEPAPAHQMRLIAAIFRRTVRVGALLSEQSAYMEPLLQRAASEHGQELETAFVDPAVSLSRNLLRLASATVILIFPDTTIYTQASLRELLETTYRRRQPVIGFSESLVAAGTLASAYSDIDDTLAQLQTVIAAAAEGRLPAPQYPRFWRVAVNDSVARSLNVVIDGHARRLGDRP